MSFSSWLRYWKRSLERRSALYQTHRRKPAARRLTPRLRLEALEDRTLLTGFTAFPVPTSSSFPNAIAQGADGNIWFTERNGDNIGRITTAGAITEFAVPGANIAPWGITAGPDGNMWFGVEGNGVASEVGRITPSGTMSLFPILPAYSFPNLTTGPDGNLWVTEGTTNQIAIVSPQGVLLNQFNIPISGGTPEFITAGPDGNLWFTDVAGTSSTSLGPVGSAYVGKLSVNGNFTIYSIPGTSNSVKAITTGPDGNLWFAEQATNKIGRLTPSGALTEFTIPTANSDPDYLRVGPDGNLWFVEINTDQIASITPSGVITEYPIPTPNSQPYGIVTGADGKLWFTEDNANQIGRYTPGPQLTVNNLTVSGSNGAVVSNSGTFSDSFGGATVTLTASAGTVVQNGNGTWSWSETTPSGAAQTAPVTIHATDSNGQTAATEFWLNVGQVFTVTNTGDNGGVNPAPGAGTGTLRQAIVDADNAPSTGEPSLIAFDIPTSDPGYNPTTGAFTITPLTPFPILSNPAVIDGYTEAGASPNTLAQGDNAALNIQLNEQNWGPPNNPGFWVSANNSTIRGLVVNNLTTTVPTVYAIYLTGSGDQVQGNFIGTDVSGSTVVGGGTGTVGVQDDGTAAVIGGTTPDARNLIAGFDEGIDAVYGGPDSVVEGNYIGTDASGTKALGNQTGVTGGIIGGTTPGAGNLISGNQTGISMNNDPLVQGNLIGTDVTGTVALGNGTGILAGGGTIGGTTAAARNIISGNTVWGINDNTSSQAQIEGNYIGTDISGTMGLGDGQAGIIVGGGDTVGGTAPGAGNVISGNGIGIRGDGNNNVIEGNLIGTDYTGTKGIGQGIGILFQDNGNNNLIGGLDTNTPGAPLAGGGNLISGNGTGISLGVGYGSTPMSGNVVEGNYIGTDITGTKAVGNYDGVSLGTNFANNTIGGTTAAARNIISGNHNIGVLIANFSGGAANLASNNVVEGNYIGTDATGSVALGNGYGFWLQGSLNNTIGGTASGGGNLIMDNTNAGIYFVWSGDANQPNSNNVVQGNAIESNPVGIVVNGGGANSIGGTASGAGNVISGNSGDGVVLDWSFNFVEGNDITNNTGNGVTDYGNDTAIGGTAAGDSNVISGNSGDGVFVTGGATGVSILTNSISASGKLGIQLDSTSNANDNQTAPVLTTATSSATSTTISGTLASVANTTFRIEFFANQSPNPSGYGEGQTFLGFATVTTNGSGNATFTATGLTALPAGQNYVSVTATNLTTGDTSQFAQDLLIAPTTTTLTSSPNPSFFGQSVTFTATVAATPTSAGTPTGSVVFVDTTTGVTLGTVALANGSATLTTSALATGANTITAQYSGASSFGGVYGVVYQPSIGSLTQTVLPTILVLNSTAGGALSLSGNSSINIPGNLIVDSSSNNALTESGNASIKAASIQVVGGVSKSGNATMTPTATTGAASVADPLANLMGPSTTGMTNYGAASYSSGAHTLNPGIYSSIQASGKASLTLNPGVYLIEGGGLVVSGNASITGTGVTIYNTSSNYPSSTGSYGGITLSGNGTFTLSAPDSGSYAGIVIFQPYANTRAIALSGNATSGLTGTIYAPSALLYVSGNASVSGAAVVNELSLSGNGVNTQAATGSDADNTGGTAGQLLAGNVEVYVDNSNGDLTADELARIQDAVSAVDAVTESYGVTVAEVTDPTQANVVLSMGTSSAAGDYAQGVLGCYATTGTITLIQGWNWYAGADPTQIGANQYDFQTTATHELGHALGLGESSNPTSAMYGTLTPGTTIRTLTTADLNIPYDEGPADAQRAALPPIRTIAGAVPVSSAATFQGMTVPSSISIPGSGNPVSAAEQVLANLALMLSEARNAYQTELSAVAAMWQSADALALQRLDALLSLEAGAMGMMKDMLMRNLLFASMSSPNGA